MRWESADARRRVAHALPGTLLRARNVFRYAWGDTPIDACRCCRNDVPVAKLVNPGQPNTGVAPSTASLAAYCVLR